MRKWWTKLILHLRNNHKGSDWYINKCKSIDHAGAKILTVHAKKSDISWVVCARCGGTIKTILPKKPGVEDIVK